MKIALEIVGLILAVLGAWALVAWIAGAIGGDSTERRDAEAFLNFDRERDL